MIEFSWEAYEDVVEHARRGDPEEVCGILAGVHDPGHTIVVDSHPTENAARNPRTRYAIDPAEQYEVIQRIEREGLETAGFYHSHPRGPSVPSAIDRDSATWSGYPYVICDLGGGAGEGSSLSAWRWDRETGSFSPESIRVAPDEELHERIAGIDTEHADGPE